MFDFYRNRPSFLTAYRYADQEQLLAGSGPQNSKSWTFELQLSAWRVIEAKLAKPR
jgi:hypothetical protein